LSSVEKMDGSVSLELVAMVPVLAFFVLITVQFSAIFHGALRGLVMSDAKAARAILEWEGFNSNDALSMPCLEKIEPNVFMTDHVPLAVGAGNFQQEIVLSQGVKIVEGPICIHD